MKVEEFIERMHRICDEESSLMKEKNALVTPRLRDYELIPELYDYCMKVIGEVCPDAMEAPTQVRRMFLFVILFLYSPRTLFGCKMRKGLRPILSRLFSRDSTLLSHYARDLVFHYEVYSDFRNNINDLIERVLSYLESR